MPMERRLAAILAADVVGYSRLMGANEVATLAEMQEILANVFDEAINQAGGRIVKLMGDGVLAEFASVVSALESALVIQEAIAKRNVGVPKDRQIHFRIGINMGDVLFEGGDIFGEGVNIAARIEALAQPGGIAVSGVVRDQVGNKLGITFDDAGEQLLKNIDGAVPVFHVRSQTGDMQPALANASSHPRIAVLPFENMSGDPEQEYFADGIAEDLITDLSKLSGLFVVGRNSAFAYKGRPTKLQDVARDLGVRNILEGSVRKSGNRLRITAQLIDGVTGGHLWAERYDRDLSNIFALQDEITNKIIDQLQVRLFDSDIAEKAHTESVDAYTLYLKGRRYFHMRARNYLEKARTLFLEAVQQDPDYARAYVGLAECEARLNDWHGTDFPSEDILSMAQRAINLDPNLAEAHASLGLALQIVGKNEAAVVAYRRALSLDPLCYDAHHNFARYHRGQLDHKQSAYHFTRALEIKPDDYRSPLLLVADLVELGRLDERDLYLEMGLKRASEAVESNPDNPDPLELSASVLASLGRYDEARAWLSRALAMETHSYSTDGYNVACVYALIGETEKALECLEKVYPSLGPVQRDWMRNDPDFQSLRNHTRFQFLLNAAPKTDA